jgi:hypothetical protein
MNHVLFVGLVFACALAAQPAPGTGSIDGHLFNSLTGAPVRKAMIELTTAQIWLSADTDAEGRFLFTALPAASYRLSVKRPGFLERLVRHPIVLGEDGHVTNIEIRLLPLSAISGRVLDEDGDPVSGAWVTVFRMVYQAGRKQWDRLGGSALTNDSGEYRRPGLTPGRYLVQAWVDRPPLKSRYGGGSDPTDKPQMRYVPAYYPSAPNQHTASPLEVGAGTEVRDIDIHLFRAPIFHVRGKVTGVSPNSRAGVTVNFTAGDGPSNLTGGGGSAEANPPDYTFDVSVLPCQCAIFAYDNGGDGSTAFATDSLTVSGNVTGVVLTMSPSPDITGLVSMTEIGSKAKLQGVRILLHRPNSWVYTPPQVQSDAAGRFIVPKPTPAGRYSISVDVRSIPDGCYVESVKLGGQEVSADDLEIRSSTEIEIVLSNKAGSITGSVSSNDGKPILNPRVTLIPMDSNSRPAEQFTDDNGKFRFAPLRPAKYVLVAWEQVEDGDWQDPEFRKKFGSHAKEITIGPRETQDVQLAAVSAEEMN